MQRNIAGQAFFISAVIYCNHKGGNKSEDIYRAAENPNQPGTKRIPKGKARC
jgi:hypothetical protein